MDPEKPLARVCWWRGTICGLTATGDGDDRCRSVARQRKCGLARVVHLDAGGLCRCGPWMFHEDREHRTAIF